MTMQLTAGSAAGSIGSTDDAELTFQE